MKDVSTLKIPKKLKTILEEEGVWESDSLKPLYITILESEYKGKSVISYQLELHIWSPEIEAFADRFELKGQTADGNKWEKILLDFIKTKDSSLFSKINCDSESETCVLWTDNETDFRSMLKIVQDLLNEPALLETLI